MQKNRLTAAQANYIERTSNPHNAMDLLLALQNPASPAFKKMMNQILLGEEIHLITDLMIERFLDQQYAASLQEKEEIYKDWLARELVAQEKMKELFSPHIQADDSRLAELDKADFVSRLDDRADLIDQLYHQHEILSSRLKELQKESEANTFEWRELQQHRMHEYVDILKEKQFELVTANGDRISADSFKAEQLIHQAFQAPAPLEILEKVGASWQKYHPEAIASTGEENMPAPPPLPALPPGFMNAAAMAGKHHVHCELKLMALLCKEHEDSASLLKVIKENKEVRNCLPGTDLSLKPGTGKKNNLEESEECRIYAKAINHYQQVFAVKQAYHQVDLQLSQAKELQEVEVAAYKKLTGKIIRMV